MAVSRNWIKIGLLASVTVMAVACKDEVIEQPAVEDAVKKPNIVFLLVDDLGYSDIGAFNPDTFYSTPNINAFAQTGVTFTNGYAASPVCSPSRVAIMTGKHPTRLATTDWFSYGGRKDRAEKYQPAIRSNELSLEEKTIAEIFKDNGYSTAFFGKWHLGEEEILWPENQGFDLNVGGAKFGHPPGGFFSPYKNPRLEDGVDGEYLTDRMTQEAVSYIEQTKDKEDPFFLFLSYYTVHVPLQAPEDLVLQNSSSDIDHLADKNFDFETQHHVSADQPRRVRVKQNHPVYAGMVQSLDMSVGAILEALEVQGLAEDTIVVFTSDNGGLSTAEGLPTSNLPLRAGKGWLYEGGTRVPLIVRAPDAQTIGMVQDSSVVGFDFLPTLASLSGIKLGDFEEQDGIDFSSALQNEDVKFERDIVWHYPHYANQGGYPGASIRRGNWKLLQNFETGEIELFNLSNDIGEKTNLVAEFPDKADELSSALNEWYTQTNAEFLRPLDDVSPEPWKP